METQKIKSLSDKRLIIEGKINDKKCLVLLDTGASVSLLNEDKVREFKIKQGRKFNGSLIGAGGEFETSYISDSFIVIGGKTTTQYIIGNITSVHDSIMEETGLDIDAIMGLPQMKEIAMIIDSGENTIIIP